MAATLATIAALVVLAAAALLLGVLRRRRLDRLKLRARTPSATPSAISTTVHGGAFELGGSQAAEYHLEKHGGASPEGGSQAADYHLDKGQAADYHLEKADVDRARRAAFHANDDFDVVKGERACERACERASGRACERASGLACDRALVAAGARGARGGGSAASATAEVHAGVAPPAYILPTPVTVTDDLQVQL